MPDLEYLNIFNNQFNGSIPTEIGLMTNVKYLDLFLNNFTESIPSEIGLLTNDGEDLILFIST